MPEFAAVHRELELLPGPVTLTLYERAFDADSTLVLYVTHGLERIGQRELVVGVLRRPADRPMPTFPVTLITLVRDAVLAGAPVEHGQTFVFAEPGLDADPRISGFTVARAPTSLPLDLPFPRRPLVLVPLVDAEAAVAQRYGSARVLTLLAGAAGRYPYPVWFEPGRAAVVDEGYARATLATKQPGCRMPALRVLHVGRRLRLELEPAGADLFRRTASDTYATVVYQPDLADTSAVYAWQPGQRGAEVFRSGGPEPRDGIGCGCLTLGRQDDDDVIAKQFEDGFALTLPDDLWDQLVTSDASGTTLDLPPGPYVTIDAVDVVVVPEQPWGRRGRHHVRHTEASIESGHVSRVDPAELAALLERVVATVDERLADAPLMSGPLRVGLELVPAAPVRAHVRSAAAAQLSGLAERLAELPAPAVSGDEPVEIDLQLTVGP